MNLLMIAPLVDSRGDTRYHIGAQVDVSGLVRDCTDLQGLQNMLSKLEGSDGAMEEDKEEFQELCEMFNDGELNAVRRSGGHMHKAQLASSVETRSSAHRPRLLLEEPSPEISVQSNASTLRPFGNLEGIYKHVSTQSRAYQYCSPLSLTFFPFRKVSSYPTCSISSYPLHVSFTSCSWHSAVFVHRSYRRLLTGTRRT